MKEILKIIILFSKKAIVITGFFCFVYTSIYSQNQRESDSLKNLFRKNDYPRAEKLKILADIAFYETDTDEIIIYSKELIASAKEMDSINRVYDGYLQLGNAHQQKGDLTKALEAFLEALKIANQEKKKANKELKNAEANTKISLANVYSEMGDGKLAVKNYKEGINFYNTLAVKNENDSINLASAEYNLGDEYYNQEKLDSALVYYKKSEKLFNALNYDQYKAYILGSEGLVYAQLDDDNLAEESLNEAIKILEKYEDYDPISEFLVGMSDVYISRNQKSKALRYAKRSLKIAEKFGYKSQISKANSKLAIIYESLGNTKKSYEAFKKYITYRDSVNNINSVRDIEQERSKFALEKKEQEKQFELKQKEQEKKILEEQARTAKILNIGIGVVVILIGILAFILFRRNKFITETNKIIEKEKQRSEDLLMNILPEETAQELKENGSVTAKSFESVSVLFTDFKGFTEYSEKLSPEDLVKSIDYYFSNFDKIMEKYDIEKIKTVGDAYMCACGLPYPEKEHSYKITLAALEIVEFINQTKFINQKNLAKFDIRVGINTGSVVSGVVGTKKFAYDIWGDTVNTASRMESSGEIGRVNISQSTYEALQHYEDLAFEPRGAIKAKGKGEIQMYFVSRKAFF